MSSEIDFNDRMLSLGLARVSEAAAIASASPVVPSVTTETVIGVLNEGCPASVEATVNVLVPAPIVAAKILLDLTEVTAAASLL